MIPKTPGFYNVSIEKNAQWLFNFFKKLAEETPHILPFKNTQKFLEFFTTEHRNDMYIYNDDKGRFIGLISIVYIPNEDTLEILAILIDPIFQRRGYGKKLAFFAEEIARKAGLKKMRLVTNTKNIPAIKFYKNIGYRIMGESKNYYEDGETRYIFEKLIN